MQGVRIVCEHSFSPLGDCAVRIGFGETISPQINRNIHRFCEMLKSTPLQGVLEWTPTYTAVTIFYQPNKTSYHKLVTDLTTLLSKLDMALIAKKKRVIVPVCYGDEFGPDITHVAQYNKLTVEEVIEIHCSPNYLIYMLGFTPGFPYMGGMSEAIKTPRLANPRAVVPAGSVGIAGEQTGIYSLSTPGGWQIIGRTPLILYDPTQEKPALLEAGNYVKFQPIKKADYEEIHKLIEEKKYKLQYDFMNE